MAKKNQQKKKQLHNQPIYSLPLLLLILIYPFLAKYSAVPNPLIDNPSYYSTETLSDIFLYVKSGFLFFIILTMVGLYLYDLLAQKRTEKLTASDYKKFIPLGVYAVFIMLSTICAENTQLALEGMPGQYESVWTLLGYLIICIFGYWYYKTATSHKFLTYAFLGGSLLMGVVFLFQFMGADPYVALFSSQNATVAVAGVYGGFFNPNYLGSYVNLVLPLLVVLLIVFRKKKPVNILLGITIALTVLGLIGSKTTGGMIGVLTICGFAALFLLFKKLHLPGITLYVCLVIVSVATITGISMYLNRMEQNELLLYERLEAIYTHDDYVEIRHGGNVFYLQTSHNDTSFQLVCTDSNGHNIPINVRENTYYFYDERLVHFSVMPFAVADLNNIVAFRLNYGNYSWFFTNDYGDGTYYRITPTIGFSKSTPEDTSEGVLFSKVPKFLSGRGYIWSQSIPLLTETLLLGYGPDNFAEHFPNHDFVAALRGGFNNTFITKPHNMYLQIGLQTGVISLVAFLIFYLVYFVKSVKLYLNADFTRNHSVFTGFGIFLGTVGYLVVGLINDSSLTVAPFFWLILGVGYAINQKIAQEQQ